MAKHKLLPFTKVAQVWNYNFIKNTYVCPELSPDVNKNDYLIMCYMGIPLFNVIYILYFLLATGSCWEFLKLNAMFCVSFYWILCDMCFLMECHMLYLIYFAVFNWKSYVVFSLIECHMLCLPLCNVKGLVLWNWILCVICSFIDFYVSYIPLLYLMCYSVSIEYHVFFFSQLNVMCHLCYFTD